MSSIELTELWYKYVQSEENGFELFKRYCGVLFSIPDNKSILYQPFKNTDFTSVGPCLEQMPKDCISVATDRLARLEMRLLQDEMLDYALLLVKFLVLLARHNLNKEAVNNQKTKSVVFALIEAAFSKLAAGNLEMSVCNGWIDLMDYLFYFLEHIYDPNFTWRNRRLTMYSGQAASCAQYTSVPNLTSEIIPWFYETFTTYDKSVPKEIRDRLLSLFCSFVCGSQNNALYLITPATLEALWKISDHSQWFALALTCILEILGGLPKYQRQVELESVVPNYVKLITSKPSLSSAELHCLEYLAKISEELFVCLIKNGIVNALCNTLLANPADSMEQIFCILSSITYSEGAIATQFAESDCYTLVSDSLTAAEKSNASAAEAEIDLPMSELQNRLFAWALGEPYDPNRIHRIRDGHVIGILVDLACRRWRQPDCSGLADQLAGLLACTRHNVSECSARGVLTRVIAGLRLVAEAEVDGEIEANIRLDLLRKLFSLLTQLASHSMSSRQLLSLLDFFQEPRLYPCAREAMQCLADVSRGQDMDRRPTRWFEIGGRGRDDFIMLPPDRIRLNAGCFTFHCWLCLYSLSTEETVGQFIRRQLYRFLTTSGNGFEAFVTQQQALGVASCSQGEYSYVILSDFDRFVDNRWHMLDIVHAKGKGLLGKSSLSVYVDGRQLHQGEMRYPQLNDPCKLAHIGNGTRTSEDSIGITKNSQRSLGFGRAFFASLSPSGRSGGGGGGAGNCSTVALGSQDSAWGSPSSLSGQLALCEAFAEPLSPGIIAELYRRGPEYAASASVPSAAVLTSDTSNSAASAPVSSASTSVSTSSASAMVASAAASSLALASSAAVAAAAAAAAATSGIGDPAVNSGRVILCLHARACHGHECLDVTGQGLSVGGITARVTSACPLAATVHQLGGPTVLLPMLERVHQYESCRVRASSGPSTPMPPSAPPDADVDDGFVLLSGREPELAVLEQSSLAAFLALMRILLETSAWNQLQALRSQLLPMVSALAQRVPAHLIDAFFLRELEMLCESPRIDEELRDKVCQHLLMDFRLWSCASYKVRCSHVQLITKLVHTRRRYFRTNFGVRYILDAIRTHCMPGNRADPFSSDQASELRRGLFTVIRIYMGHSPNFDELQTVFRSLYTAANDTLISETLQMLTELMEHATKSSQLVLLIYEKPLGPSLYYMIASSEVSLASKAVIFQFLLNLIRSDKMDAKYKAPLFLQGVGFAGLLTAWQLDVPSHSTEGVDAIGGAVIDVLEAAPNGVDRTGFMELLTYLTYAGLPLKLRAVRGLLNLLVASPEAAESLTSGEPGWQKLVVKLWVAAPPAGDQLLLRLASSETMQQISCLPASRIAADSPPTTPTPFRISLPSNENDEGESQAFDERDAGDPAAVDAAATLTPSVISDVNDVLTVENSKFDFSQSASAAAALEQEEFAKSLLVVTHILLWRGVRGSDDAAWLERIQVFACLREIGDNFELIRPASWIRQKVLEEMVLACYEEIRQTRFLSSGLAQKTLRILQLVHETVASGNSKSSSTASSSAASSTDSWFGDADSAGGAAPSCGQDLIDACMLLLNSLHVWEDAEIVEANSLAAIGLNLLLDWAKSPNQSVVAAACSNLHQVITLRHENPDELCFIMDRLLEDLFATDFHYGHKIPVLKSALVLSNSLLQLNKNLPTLASHLDELSVKFRSHFYNKPEWDAFLTNLVKTSAEVFQRNHLDQAVISVSLVAAQADQAKSESMHRRNRLVRGPAKLLFDREVTAPVRRLVQDERRRLRASEAALRNQDLAAMRQWRSAAQFLMSERGPWPEPREGLRARYWRLSLRENFMRMRPVQEPNYAYDRHSEASRLRDNCDHRVAPQLAKDPATAEEKEEGEDAAAALELGRRSKFDLSQLGEDQIGDEEWHLLNEVLTADVAADAAAALAVSSASSTGNSSGELRRVSDVPCTLVTLVQVCRGTVDVSPQHLYFHELAAGSSPAARGGFPTAAAVAIKEEGLPATQELKIRLGSLREIHLRRYNLRRTAVEIFLADRTSYFLNFDDTKTRDKVFANIVRDLKTSVRFDKTPAALLKKSKLTERWRRREISNFHYLMELNTIAGRTYNDIAQYPVFPWVLADYTSPYLDLSRSETFRDLSRPIGLANPENEAEVDNRFEESSALDNEAPSFHYGTHYSNPGGVMHYLIRVEPFTSMHIDLQSGRFDLADRQFHSIADSWRGIMANSNDNKELVPEFYYYPECLLNLNQFDLGRMQISNEKVDDVVLPPWATDAYDFVRQHRSALESDHVSANLHHWIDLIFGYKQRGPAAIAAKNVFMHCAYEGMVNLDDQTMDPKLREQFEAIISNFGQVPSQLLTEPHPRRLTREEALLESERLGQTPSLVVNPHLARTYFTEVCPSDDPCVWAGLPPGQAVGPFSQGQTLITASQCGQLHLHTWTEWPSRTPNFAFERDSALTSAAAASTNNGTGGSGGSTNSSPDSSGSGGGNRRLLAGPFAPTGQRPGWRLFAVTTCGRYLFCAGVWDGSVQAWNLTRGRCEQALRGHSDTVTCMRLDSSSRHLITGSADGTAIVWRLSLPNGGGGGGGGVGGVGGGSSSGGGGGGGGSSGQMLGVEVYQVLSGHYSPLLDVSLASDLDICAMASESGLVTVMSLHRGHYLRSLSLPDTCRLVRCLHFTDTGALLIAWLGPHRGKSYASLFSPNGRPLFTLTLDDEITCLAGVGSDYVTLGCRAGKLLLIELASFTPVREFGLAKEVTSVMAHRETHLLVTLGDGKLIVITADLKGTKG